MRAGQDRHELADELMTMLYPDDAPTLRNLAVGDRIVDIAAKEGRDPDKVGGAAEFVFDVRDPLSNGRKLTLRMHQQQARASSITAVFVSSDRMDVDAVYRLVKKHLKTHHGRPGKESGGAQHGQASGALKFVWEHPSGELPSRTTVCRYKDNAKGVSLLEISTRLADGVRLPSARPPGLTGLPKLGTPKGPVPGKPTG